MEKCDKKDDWKIKEEMTKHQGECTRENIAMEDDGKKIFPLHFH